MGGLHSICAQPIEIIEHAVLASHGGSLQITGL